MDQRWVILFTDIWNNLPWIIPAGYFLVMYILGATNRIGVWENFTDAGMSFMLPLVTAFTVGFSALGLDTDFSHPDPWHIVIGLVCYGVALVLSVLLLGMLTREYEQAASMNSGGGVIIAAVLFRVLFSFLGIFILCAAVCGRDSRSASDQFASALMIIGLFGMLFMPLVNGGEVLQRQIQRQLPGS